MRHSAQKVCIIDRAQLAAFNISVRAIEPAPIKKHPHQVVVIQEQLKLPVKNRCNPEGCLEVVNRLGSLSHPAMAYFTKDETRLDSMLQQYNRFP